MFEQKITFDSFIRSITVLCLSVGAVWLLNTLSSVLLPFFIAWLLAYLLYPLVRFIQHRLRLRNRILSIVVALLFVFALLAGFIALIVPPIIKETIHIAELTTLYFHDVMTQTNMSKYIQNVVDYLSNKNTLVNLVQQSSFIDAMQTVMLQTWNYSCRQARLCLYGGTGCQERHECLFPRSIFDSPYRRHPVQYRFPYYRFPFGNWIGLVYRFAKFGTLHAALRLYPHNLAGYS